MYIPFSNSTTFILGKFYIHFFYALRCYLAAF